MLVNTIGTYGLGEALTATPEDLRLMIDVNVGAALWLNQAVSRTGGTAVRVPSWMWPPARAWSRRPGWPPTPSARRPWSTSPACSTWSCARRGSQVNAVAPQLLDTPRNRQYFTPDLLAHAVAPGAAADIIVYLVSDAAAPVRGAVVPAYGA